MADPPVSLVVALGAVGVAFGWTLAALLVAAGPRRLANVALASTFFLIGNALGLSRIAAIVPDVFLAYNMVLWAQVANNLIPIAYLLFIGAALETPVARPFRSRAGRALLALAAVALALHPLLAPTDYIFSMTWTGSSWVSVRATTWGDLLNAVTLLVTLTAAITAWRLAPRGSVRRERSARYALAFGAQDTLVGVLFVTLLLSPASRPWTMDVGVAIASATTMPLIAYVLLRYHLFDVELRIKAGLRRSTVAAVFVASFFVVAAIAEQWLQQRGGILLGGIAVGLLVFALRPIERAAERLANTAMPAVQATPEYLAFRKLDVYRAAVESAHETGGITDKERLSLDGLRGKLGIAPGDAAAVEREIIA